MGLCAQTPGHIVVQEKGFSCTHIEYTTMDAILHIEKNINFLTFSIYFSKKIGFMEKLYKKKKKI